MFFRFSVDNVEFEAPRTSALALYVDQDADGRTNGSHCSRSGLRRSGRMLRVSILEKLSAQARSLAFGTLAHGSVPASWAG